MLFPPLSLSSLKNPTPFSPGDSAELCWYKDGLLALDLPSRKIHSLSGERKHAPSLPCRNLFFAGTVIFYPQEEKRAVLESRQIHICFCFSLSFKHCCNHLSIQWRARHNRQARKTHPCERNKNGSQICLLNPTPTAIMSSSLPTFRDIRVLGAEKHRTCAEQSHYFAQNNLWSR